MVSRFLVVPDSFKGSMSALDVCRIVADTIRTHIPDASVRCVPIADGGEGSVDAFLAALAGRKVTVPCAGPYGETIPGSYGLLEDGTAVVEMAAAAGLPLVGRDRRPDATSTFGVGQLLLDALDRGARSFIVGLGGSCTNDGGCGMAAACGVRFRDPDGRSFVPTGGTLGQIASIDASGLDGRLTRSRIVTMCDIDNPLCGRTGAAAVFGPQKGATPAMVERLDAGLSHLADVIRHDLGCDVRDLPGAGAAGGMGAGMVAFFGSRLQMGVRTVLDAVDFDRLLAASDVVISGEGNFDAQSLRGKVVVGVARRCKEQGKPLVALVGGFDPEAVPDAVEAGVGHLGRISPADIPLEEAIAHAPDYLAAAAGRLCELLADAGGVDGLPAVIRVAG